MCETCDIVIELISGSFWQVFSKDKQLIDRETDGKIHLHLKVHNIEFLPMHRLYQTKTDGPPV
jgi:hypothetical protein